jgi:hypothetical protein
MSTTGLESRIPPDYRHVAKLARPAPGIDLAGSTLKWYDVARATAPVPDEIRALARAGLEEAARRGGLALADDVGFVILHRCGRDFYFLLVCTWRNQNEVWETVFAKDGDADPAFRPWPAEGPHRPTFCVWELGVVGHEQRAWTRYLRSDRDAAALQTYLEDGFDGSV